MTTSVVRTEGSDLYDELIAVHTIMRRGVKLAADAFAGRVAGEAVDTKTLVNTTRWLVTFVHHHHQSEDELFWPVLRERFPEIVAELDQLTAEHHALDVELKVLSEAVDALAAGGRSADDAARRGADAAEKVRTILLGHLDEEEPALVGLMPQVPDEQVNRLRKAIVDGAPKAGPDLVLGLLEDPGRPAGYDLMMANFPPPVRWLRPLLLRRYRSRVRALGQAR